MLSNMTFIVCLVFLTTAGFTSGQSTQEVRAHSGYTREGQCSYTFVLPPSSVQQCGSGQGEADLQQIREQMSDMQIKFDELTSDLRQQNDVLEQRLSALEGRNENTTQTDSGGYLPSNCTEVVERSGFNNQAFYVAT
ncbi:uncharacterized protein [Branchiostoma lanceolatum]|uniref:uncharacterized protein n=1 Tax=Branchiostoma lanceolatum TaxID=7740 RepID=UPI003452EB69